MEFNFKKYIAIFCVLILITSVSIGLVSLDGSKTGEGSVTPPVIEVPVEDPNEEPTTTEVPSFSNALDCWNYAFNILQNGKGCEIECVVAASSQISGIGGTQYVYYQLLRNGKNYLENSIVRSDISILGVKLGENFHKKVFYDGTTYTRKVARDDNFTKKSTGTNGEKTKESFGTFDSIPQETLNNEQYLADTPSGIEFMPFDFSSAGCSQVYFKKMNANYYEFEIALNTAKIPTVYTQNIKNNAKADKLVWNSVVFKAFVSKKTGKFMSIKKTENYVMTPWGLADLTVNGVSNYTIKSDVAPDFVMNQF